MFENDPAVYADPANYQPYNFTEAAADAYYDKQENAPDRVYLAIMLRSRPIGEVILKNIDRQTSSCTLSIHLQNDAVKNQGYGTQAERLAVAYAFTKLHLLTVNADVLCQNIRSQRALEKAGFQIHHRDSEYVYYKYTRTPESAITGCEL